MTTATVAVKPAARAKKLPLGIRTHNPGLILRVAGVTWEGQSEKQGGRFMHYKSPPYGIRAIVRVLITYADARYARDGSRIDTVAEIIDRWAPPVENDTDAYADHVRARLGVKRGEILAIKEWSTMKGLIKAIIHHENGMQPYTDAQIEKAMVMAGLEPPARPSLQATRTVKGGQVAGAAGAASAIAGGLAEWTPALPMVHFLRDNLGLALLIGGAVVLIGVGVMIYARWDDHRKGLR